MTRATRKKNSFTFLFLSPSHPQSFLTLYSFFRAQLEFRRPELLSDIFAICGPEPVNRRALPFGFAAASGSAALSHPSLFRPSPILSFSPHSLTASFFFCLLLVSFPFLSPSSTFYRFTCFCSLRLYLPTKLLILAFAVVAIHRRFARSP